MTKWALATGTLQGSLLSAAQGCSGHGLFLSLSGLGGSLAGTRWDASSWAAARAPSAARAAKGEPFPAEPRLSPAASSTPPPGPTSPPSHCTTLSGVKENKKGVRSDLRGVWIQWPSASYQHMKSKHSFLHVCCPYKKFSLFYVSSQMTQCHVQN